MTNSQEQSNQEQQLAKAVKKLLSYDSAKNIRANIADMFFAYNQSDLSDCQSDRTAKTGTFIYLGDFLTSILEITTRKEGKDV